MRFSRTACLGLALLMQVAAAGPVRVRFAPGRTTAEVHGRFTAQVREENFVVRASSGQHMKVEVKPLSPGLMTAGEVKSPEGHSDGGPGGVIFDSDLRKTGDYGIRVFERQQSGPGSFLLHIEIR